MYDLNICQPVKNKKRLISGYTYVNHNAHRVSPGACEEAEGRIEMCNNFTNRFVWWVRLIHWGLPV